MPLTTTPLNPGVGGANIVTDQQPSGAQMPVSELAVSPDGVQASTAVTELSPLPVEDGEVLDALSEIIHSLERLRRLLDPPLKVLAPPVSSAVATAPAQLTVGTSAVQVFAANLSRKRCYFQNSGVYPVYLGFNASPTTVLHHVELAPCSNYVSDGTGGSWTEDMFKGPIYAISTNAAGALNTLELL